MAITVTDLTEAATALIDADKAVASAEKELAKAKERQRYLREETIPNAMQELGIQKLTLTNGRTLGVKQEVYASIPDSTREHAFDWLNKNGFGGLIKVVVGAQYGRGDREKAQELFDELTERGLEPAFSEDIHSQTLKAFLREQVAKGKDVPLDLFGARPVWTAKISK